MVQELLQPEEFLDRLGKAFAEPSSSGSIWLAHKRYTFEEEHADDTMEVEGEEESGVEHDVLIRCIHGDAEKFSSRIPASRLIEFHTKYGSLLKSSLAPKMRKRDKKKEKARAEAVAQKKRELYVDIDIGNEGKRGKGRRQRARKIAAQKKKELERERVEARESERQKTGGQGVLDV